MKSASGTLHTATLPCRIDHHVAALVGRDIVMRVLHRENEVAGDFEDAFSRRIAMQNVREKHCLGRDETGTNLCAEFREADVREAVKALRQLHRQCLIGEYQITGNPAGYVSVPKGRLNVSNGLAPAAKAKNSCCERIWPRVLSASC